MIVLDTNVVSETMAAVPHRSEPPMLTVITVAEIRFGVAILPKGARKRRLSEASERMFSAFGPSRILAFDEPASEAYATIAALRCAAGRPVSQLDAMIAAICSTRGARP